MSFRNWLPHDPVGIGLIASATLILLALAYYDHQAGRAYDPTTQKYEETKWVTPLGTSPQGVNTDPKSYRDEWRAERDLEAQREMARWAKWLFYATGFGIALLAATLWETRRAAHAADEILGQTKRQADISEASAERQLRAYVGTGSIYFGKQINDPDDVIYVVVESENFGSTPAHHFQTSLSLLVDRPPGIFGKLPALMKEEHFTGKGKTLMPRGKAITICEIKVVPSRPQFLESLRADQSTLYLQGGIFYRDIFGRPHLTHVRMRAQGRRIDTNSPFIVAEEGNESD